MKTVTPCQPEFARAGLVELAACKTLASGLWHLFLTTGIHRQEQTESESGSRGGSRPPLGPTPCWERSNSAAWGATGELPEAQPPRPGSNASFPIGGQPLRPGRGPTGLPQ